MKRPRSKTYDLKSAVRHIGVRSAARLAFNELMVDERIRSLDFKMKMAERFCGDFVK